MSESEFDKYLALLTSLLRLDTAQRESIAGELRDHMEDRLQELLDEGFDHHRAVTIALEEFGDAAGLAAQFVSVSRHQRKRWIMRFTTASAIGMASIVVLALMLWPDPAQVPVATHAMAQDIVEDGGDGTDSAKPARRHSGEPTIEENNKATDRKLAKRISADFIETPFSDVIGYLSEITDTSFYLNKRALEEHGFDDDSAAVTITLKSVRGDMLLDLVLKQIGLVYIVQDGIIIVSTPEDVETVSEVRVYNCRDLLAQKQTRSSRGGRRGSRRNVPEGDDVDVPSPETPLPGTDSSASRSRSRTNLVLTQFGPSAGGGAYGGSSRGPSGSGSGYGRSGSSSAKELMDLVTSTVMPETWAVTGGAGTIEQFNGLLVVNHNPQAHRQIERLLSMMRSADDKAPGAIVGPNN